MTQTNVDTVVGLLMFVINTGEMSAFMFPLTFAEKCADTWNSLVITRLFSCSRLESTWGKETLSTVLTLWIQWVSSSKTKHDQT